MQEYLNAVAEQIRWKRARPVVLRELAQHLSDQREAFFWEEDCTAEEAERMAVEEMGDPVSVGMELDRVHRPKPQWGLLLWAAALAVAGVVLRMWLTAGSEAFYVFLRPERMILSLVLGCALMVGMYLLDYTFLLRYAPWVYAVSMAVCLLMLKISPRINGASYYTRILAYFLPMAYAVWLYTCRGKGWQGFILAIAGGMMPVLICMLAPCIPALFILLVSGLVLLLYAVWSGWLGDEHKIGMTAAAGGIVLVCVSVCANAMMEGYFDGRLLALLHPERDPLGVGYQALMLRKALESSVWWGQGSWPAGERYPFELAVPNWESDCFLTTVIYRLGWGPFLLLTAAFAVLMGWMLYRGLRQKSRPAKLLVFAAVLLMSLQGIFSVVLNLGFVLFNAGMPLVMGNLQTVLNLALVGLVLSVFRGDAISREPMTERKRVSQRKRLRVRLVCEWV